MVDYNKITDWFYKKRRECEVSRFGNGSGGLPRRWKTLPGRIGRNWELYLFVLPLVVYLIVFRYVPMYGVQIAFKDFSVSRGIQGSEWVGLRYLSQFFRSFYFETVIRNTLTLTILSLILGFPLPVLLALALNETAPRLKKTVQTVTFAPHFISTVVMCGIILIFTSPSSGLINNIIAALGGERVNIMQKTGMFKWVYILSGIWQETGWSSIIYVAALSNVSSEQLEAAWVDGANKLQRVIYINFPVLVPTIITLLILRCGSLLSVGYEKVYLLQNSVNIPESEVISTYVYKSGLESNNYSLSAAVGLFNSVINSSILIAVNWISRKVGENSLW